MATIITKHSTVAGRVPTAADLEQGELAVNLADKKLFTKDQTDAVVEISGGGGELVPATISTLGGVIVPPDGGLDVDAFGNISISAELLDQIGFAPSGTVFVDLNGDPVSGSGSRDNPFSTISQAIAQAPANSLVLVGPGVFADNIITSNKQLYIKGAGNDGNYNLTRITGYLQHGGTAAMFFENVGIQYTGTGGSLRINQVGSTAGVKFKGITIQASSSQTALLCNDSVGAWTGSATFDNLFVNDGKLQFDAGYTSIRMFPQDSNSIVEVNGGTVDINEAWRLQRIVHTNGALYLNHIRSVGASAGVSAIESTATNATGNVLVMANVNTWVDPSTQSFINKTGNCPYSITNVSRNLTLDVYAGLEVPFKLNYDRDTIATRTGVNYTGATGAYVSAHLSGIDTALGQRLTQISSAGGTTLVNNTTGGVLKGLTAGGGIVLTPGTTDVTISSNAVLSLTSAGTGTSIINAASGELRSLAVGAGLSIAAASGTITLTNTGVVALSSVTGSTSLVNTTAGQIKALAAGTGITIDDTGGTVTLSSTATAGVNSVNTLAGDVNVTAGSGIAVNVTGQDIEVSNTGVLSLTSVAGGTSIVNAASGQLKSLVAGTNITFTENAGQLTIDASGGGAGTISAVESATGTGSVLVADDGSTTGTAVIKRIEAGANISLVETATSLQIAAAGGASGLASVANGAGTGAGWVSDDGSASGVAVIKRVVAGTNLTATEAADDITLDVDLPDMVTSINSEIGAVQVVGGTDIQITTAPGQLTVAYVGSATGTKVASLNGLFDDVNLTAGSNITITPNNVSNTIEVAVTGAVGAVNDAETTVPGATPLVADSGSVSGTAAIKQLVPGSNIVFTADGQTVTMDVIGGAGTVKSVNNVEPTDLGIGNVQLTPADLGALALTGGTMEGAIDMATFAIKNVADPVDAQDPITLNYLNSGELIIDNGTF